MEEPKRVQFTTLEGSQKNEKTASLRKSVRFNLDLPATTDTTCPEFSFTELLKSVAGEDKSDDPFGDDDDADKLAAIAKSFEERYKPKMGKKKRKNKDFLEDLVDLGDGYDENDTFIDNSEAEYHPVLSNSLDPDHALHFVRSYLGPDSLQRLSANDTGRQRYDEVVPATITTKLGGFYINSGKLDFREISDDSDNDFQPQPGSEVKKKQNKRRISSDDESGQENKKIVKKKKVKDSLTVDGEVKKKKKKKLVLPDEEKSAKEKDKAKQNKSSTVSALLKQQTANTSPKQNGENILNGIGSPIDIDDSDDDVPKAAERVMSTKDDSNSQEMDESKKDPEKIPNLPINLPKGLDKTIESLKILAKESGGEGKLKFFTGNINKLLLHVEMVSTHMTVGNRSSMYGHLAAFLPCSKETLLKRAKTLRVKEMDDKIRGPLEKLKDAVNKIMPRLQEKYEIDLKNAQEAAKEGKSEENKEAPNEKEKTGDSDNEEGKVNPADGKVYPADGKVNPADGKVNPADGKVNPAEPVKKKSYLPVKRFVWDHDIRELLCDVVKVKMEMFDVFKIRGVAAEDYLKEFLEKEIRPIWPKGWMQNRILHKESKSVHQKWTNTGQKPKKNVLVTKTPGSAPTVSHVIKTANQGSAPAAVTSSKVTGISSSKHTPLVADSARTVLNIYSQNTPVVATKKIVPTLLDYTNGNSYKNSATVLPNSAKSGVNVSNAEYCANNPASNTSVPFSKAIDSNPQPSKPRAESWNHAVHDILRQSNTNKPASKAAVPTMPPFQRQNSSNFSAEFQKFASGGVNQSISPTEQSHGQLGNQQQKTGIDLSQSKGQGQGAAVKEKKLQEAQEKQIQHLIELEKRKQAHKQLLKLASQVKNIQGNPDASPNSVTIVKKVTSPGQNFGAGGDTGQRSLPSKPLQINKNLSLLTESCIRQQLDKHRPPVSSGVGKSVGQIRSVNDFNNSSMSSADPLRKTSPTAAVIYPNVSMSQGKTQVVRVAQVQGNSSPLPSSDSNIATSLLRSLFAGEGALNLTKPLPSSVASGTHNTTNQSRSLMKPPVSSGHGLTPKWSPESLGVSGYHGSGALSSGQHRLSFEGSRDGSGKTYSISGTNPQTVAGYPTGNVSKFSPDLKAAFQLPPGMPAQPHRSPETGRYGNQMVPHTSPGSHPTHLSPQNQRPSLNYGYPYPDKMQ